MQKHPLRAYDQGKDRDLVAEDTGVRYCFEVHAHVIICSFVKQTSSVQLFMQEPQ